MNIRKLTLGLLPILFLAGACIREEALNAEADIESCTLAGDVLNRDPVIENDKVTLLLKKGTDLTALAPEFTLTPGATIDPESGTVRDFTAPQYYVVTSEDRQWSKQYRIEATTSGLTATTYAFENVRMDDTGRYQIFYETDASGAEILTWASGNPGFALTGAGADYTDYPTYQSAIGYKGKCLALTTRRTGSFGNRVNMPIASGSLFLGTFDVLSALSNALTSTKLGEPFYCVPSRLRGYYKYCSGDTFYELDKTASDKLKAVPGKRDVFDIYAVFYESTEEMETLDGTNSLSEDNENILAVARISDAEETDAWTPFEIDFIFRPGKNVDPEKLEEGKYSLAIVFASSARGDYFEGAPGSTLCIDEVTLEYENPEE